MGEDGKVIYKVVIDDQGVENEAEAAGEKAGRGVAEGSRQHTGAFREIWVGAMREIGAALVNMAKQGAEAFVDVTKAALDSTASLEQNVGGIETLFGQSADTVIANAEKAYKTAGMSANQYMETVTSFSASLLQSLGGDTQAAASAADKAVIDMADNANKMGTDIASIQSAYQGFAKQNYTMLDNLKLGYGGTKTEMERLIADAEALNTSFQATRDENGNLTMSFSDITEAIHIVQENMGITGATAAEASSTIEGSMASAKAAYDNFLNGSGTAEEFADAILTAADNIANNLVVIVERFATELPDLVSRLGQALPGLVSKVGPPLFKAVSGIISALINLLLDNLPNMVETGVRLLVSLLDGISSDMPKIISTVLLVVTTLLTSLLDHLPELINAGMQILSGLITGIVDAIPQLISMLPVIINTMVNVLLQHLPQLIQSGIQLLVALGTGLIQAIPQLIAMLPQIISTLVQAFKNTDWASIGSNIVSGIWNGIKGLWSSLVDAVRNAVNNLWQSAKQALGIASPSKKFKYIGEMTTEGTIEGIEDTEAEMTRTVTDVYSGLSDSANMALTRDMGSLERDVSFNMTATGSTPDMTIVVPLTLDGREIARATAWQMGEQLAWEEM